MSDKSYVKAFEKIRSLLVSFPIMQPPIFFLPFEIMWDASDFVTEVVLGRRVIRMPRVIYFVAKL